MRILIAPNAFKSGLGAREAAEAIGRGLMNSRLKCSVEHFPVGDGGDGTAEVLIHHLGGERIPVEVRDPFGRPVTATLGSIDSGRTAVIEMADASGLKRLHPDELDPLRANTVGTGDMIKAALDRGARKIVLGVGGSASVDGGAGILQALGVRFLDAAGKAIENLPADLASLASLDIAGLDPRLADSTITILCDVDNPLLGDNGAAAVFGPQKGATPAMVATLEIALARFSRVVLARTGIDVSRIPGGGCAGGVSAILHGLLKARLVHGIDYFLDATDFEHALENADVVITGEGSIDEQTLQGKAPYGVAVRAKRARLPVAALAGNVPLLANSRLEEYFDILLPIGAGPAALPQALLDTAQNLERTSRQLGNLFALRRLFSKTHGTQ